MKRQSEIATEPILCVRLCAAVVYAHATIVLVHGAAHARLRVALSTWAGLFVALVVGVAPILALVLLKRGKSFHGAAILGSSMAASFSFGVWNHFLLHGGDHVAHVANGPWKLPFQITAGLLVLTEGTGSILAVQLLRVQAWGQQAATELRRAKGETKSDGRPSTRNADRATCRVDF